MSTSYDNPPEHRKVPQNFYTNKEVTSPYVETRSDIQQNSLEMLERMILNMESNNKKLIKYIIIIFVCIALILIPIGVAVYYSYENNIKTWARWSFAYPFYIILYIAIYAIIIILEYNFKNMKLLRGD